VSGDGFNCLHQQLVLHLDEKHTCKDECHGHLWKEEWKERMEGKVRMEHRDHGMGGISGGRDEWERCVERWVSGWIVGRWMK